jgi:hypothetical protein
VKVRVCGSSRYLALERRAGVSERSAGCYAGIKALLDSYDIILSCTGWPSPTVRIRLLANRAVILPLSDSQANRVASL